MPSQMHPGLSHHINPGAMQVFNLSISEYSGKSARLLCGDKEISGTGCMLESSRKVEGWEGVGIEAFMTNGCGQPHRAYYIYN